MMVGGWSLAGAATWEELAPLPEHDPAMPS